MMSNKVFVSIATALCTVAVATIAVFTGVVATSGATVTDPSVVFSTYAISAGNGYSVAIESQKNATTGSYQRSYTGYAHAWGDNSKGQLGTGLDMDYSSEPEVVNPNVASQWREISAGDSHVLAITNSGQLWGWGDNSRGQLGHDPAVLPYTNEPVRIGTATNWYKVAAGGEHSLALAGSITSGAYLFAWGKNEQGQLGLDEKYMSPVDVHTPTQVGTSAWFAIAAGKNHSLGIAWTRSFHNIYYDGGGMQTYYQYNGALYGWGDNSHGQVGDGTKINRYAPVQVKTGAAYFDSISAGDYHSVAMYTSRATNISHWLPYNDPYYIVASGIYTWGRNDSGQLGNGSATTDDVLEPSFFSGTNYSYYGANVENGPYWTSISAGGSHTLALNSEGKMYAWGLNTNKQLGIGSSARYVATPTQVGEGQGWSAVAAGANHSLAAANGRLYSWGRNNNGQLGQRDTTDVTTPTLAASYGDVHTITYSSNISTITPVHTNPTKYSDRTLVYKDLTAPTNTSVNYRFVEWREYLDGSVISVVPHSSWVGTNAGNRTIYAIYEQYYTVTFNLYGGNIDGSTANVSAAGISANAEVPYESWPQEPKRNGFFFAGWYTSAAGAQTRNESLKWNLLTDKVTGNTTLYAGWNWGVAVSYNSMSGSAVDSLTKTSNELLYGNNGLDSNGEFNGVFSGDFVVPTRAGFQFMGWFKTSTGSGGTNYANATRWNPSTDRVAQVSNTTASVTNTTGATTTTIYAGWRSQIAITLNMSGVNATLPTPYSGSTPAVYVNQGGGDVTIEQATPINYPEQYRFDGWARLGSDGKVGEVSWYNGSQHFEAATTLYAVWSIKHLVEFDTNDGRSKNSVISSQYIQPSAGYPSSVNGYATRPTDPTRSGTTTNGWQFEGWYTSQTYANDKDSTVGKVDFASYQVTQSIVLYARWVPSYTVSFSANNGVFPDGKTYWELPNVREGTTINLPSVTPSRDGYTLVAWYKEPACINEWNFSIDQVTEATTLYARWAKSYNITYENMRGATNNTLNPGIYYAGDPAKTLHDPATIADGYEGFVEWRLNNANGVRMTSIPTTTITNVVLWAVWRDPIPYTVTYDMGTATGKGISKGSLTYTTETTNFDVILGIPSSEYYTDGEIQYSFAGWTLQGESAIMTSSRMLANLGHKTLVATWTPAYFITLYRPVEHENYYTITPYEEGRQYAPREEAYRLKVTLEAAYTQTDLVVKAKGAVSNTTYTLVCEDLEGTVVGDKLEYVFIINGAYVTENLTVTVDYARETGGTGGVWMLNEYLVTMPYNPTFYNLSSAVTNPVGPGYGGALVDGGRGEYDYCYMVAHGQSLNFHVDLTSAFTQTVPELKVNGETLEILAGIHGSFQYTIPEGVITGPTVLTIDTSAWQLNRYIIKLPEDKDGVYSTVHTPKVYEAKDGGYEVPHGSPFTFRLSLELLYNRQIPVARWVSGTEIPGVKNSDGDWDFTIPGELITENTLPPDHRVSIDEIGYNSYIVKLPVADSLKYTTEQTTAHAASAGGYTVSHGEVFKFKLTLTTRYNLATPQAFAYGIELDREEISSGVFEYTIPIGYVANDTTITLSAIPENRYDVTWDQGGDIVNGKIGNGYILSAYGATSTLTSAAHNGEYWFSVTLSASHSQAIGLSVTIGSDKPGTATLVADGQTGNTYIYKISGVTWHQAITVDVTANDYAIEIASGTKVTVDGIVEYYTALPFDVVSGINVAPYVVKHGENYYFTVVLEDNYANSAIEVDSTDGTADIQRLSDTYVQFLGFDMYDAQGRTIYYYAIYNVKQDQKVSIVLVNLNSYNVFLPNDARDEQLYIIYTVGTLRPNEPIRHGTMYQFTVTMGDAYTQTKVDAAVYDSKNNIIEILTPTYDDLLKVYYFTINSVTADCYITIRICAPECTSGHTPGPAASCGTPQTCLVCSEILNVATGLHAPGTAATCTTDQKCLVCSAVLVAAPGHTPGAAATCTEDQVCTVCTQVLVSAPGHTEGPEATCGDPQICTVCLEELNPAAGEHTPGAAATCTEDQVCTVCDEVLVEAPGHTEGPEATCGDPQICTVCLEELNPVAGEHTSGGDATGTTDEVCTKCGDVIVAATGLVTPVSGLVDGTYGLVDFTIDTESEALIADINIIVNGNDIQIDMDTDFDTFVDETFNLTIEDGDVFVSKELLEALGYTGIPVTTVSIVATANDITITLTVADETHEYIFEL